MLGTPGEEREVLVQTDQQTTQQPTRLIILGPETARVDMELRAEAKLVTCDPRGMPPARIKVGSNMLENSQLSLKQVKST